MENIKPTEILFTSPGTDISHQIIFSYWTKYKLNSSKKPLVYCSVLLFSILPYSSYYIIRHIIFV